MAIKLGQLNVKVNRLLSGQQFHCYLVGVVKSWSHDAILTNRVRAFYILLGRVTV